MSQKPELDPAVIEREIAEERRRRDELQKVLRDVEASVAATTPKQGRIRLRAAANDYGRELELSIQYRPAVRNA